MFDALEVCAQLKRYAVFENLDAKDILPEAQYALDFVMANLKSDADPENPLVMRTAVAVAKFELFKKSLGESERFRSYKAGDITIQKEPTKEFETEKSIFDSALAAASGILKDGGFVFVGR